MSRHYCNWIAEPEELEEGELYEMQSELAEIADRERMEVGADKWFEQQTERFK